VKAQVIPGSVGGGGGGGGLGGGGSSLVFSPGGTAGPNVFTTEATLAAATATLNGGEYTIFFDLSHVAGTYAFTTVGMLALAGGGKWTDDGLSYTITFNAGTTLPAPPALIAGTLTVDVAQAVPLCTVSGTNGVTAVFDDAAIEVSGAGAFILCTAGIYYVAIYGNVEIGGGSNTERALQTSGAGAIELIAADQTTVQAFAIDSGCTVSVASADLGGIDGVTDPVLYQRLLCEGLFVDRVGGAVAAVPAASAFFLDDTQTGKKYWAKGSNWLQLGTTLAAYASRPPAGLAGREFVATDTGVVKFVDDGTNWRPMVDGVMGTEVAPAGSLAAYTFTNTAGGSFFQTAGIATIRAGGGSADQITMADKPRAGGQGITCALRGYMLPTQDGAFCSFGVHLRNPTSGAIILLALTLSTLTSPNYGGNLLQGEIYVNATTFGARFFNLRSFGYGTLGTIWLRVIESGGNYVFGFSQDGRNFESAGGPAIAAGNTQAGFFLNPNSLTGAVDCLSLVIA
jgi:hypothetical protein